MTWKSFLELSRTNSHQKGNNSCDLTVECILGCVVFNSVFNIRDIEMLLTRVLPHTVPIQWKTKRLSCSQPEVSSLQINNSKWNHLSQQQHRRHTWQHSKLCKTFLSFIQHPLLSLSNFFPPKITWTVKQLQYSQDGYTAFVKCFLLYCCLGDYRDHTYCNLSWTTIWLLHKSIFYP